MNLNAPTSQKPKPAWLAVKAFAACILVGAGLLGLPFSSRTGEPVDPLNALFTATSATCVTGLTVMDTGTTFSLAGQLVILALVQVGGLGVMTFGTFFLVALGRRLGLQEEFVLMDSLGHEGIRGLRGLVVITIAYTAILEAAGTALLAWRFAARGHPLGEAAYLGAFHAVSAFCNAGFGLYPDNLIPFQRDPVALLTIATLIVLGGLGFLVLYNFTSIRFWRRDLLRRGRLTLHSRIVVVSTLALIAVGWMAFLALEYNGTLRHLPWPDKAVCALFQSVTPRTAGFNAVDMAGLRAPTVFLTVLLMFIGGSPASTAGGVKTTTLVVLVLTVSSMVRGRLRPEVHGKSIPAEVVREATTIFLLGLLTVVVFSFAMTMTEALTPLCAPHISTTDAVVFETVSAFGTVGLSLGLTPLLSPFGKLCIIVCMFLGRLGPLTVALVIGTHGVKQLVRYPEEPVVVG